eukprot:421007-Pyramimonas_sp.AAC.1
MTLRMPLTGLRSVSRQAGLNSSLCQSLPQKRFDLRPSFPDPACCDSDMSDTLAQHHATRKPILDASRIPTSPSRNDAQA